MKLYRSLSLISFALCLASCGRPTDPRPSDNPSPAFSSPSATNTCLKENGGAQLTQAQRGELIKSCHPGTCYTALARWAEKNGISPTPQLLFALKQQLTQ